MINKKDFKQVILLTVTAIAMSSQSMANDFKSTIPAIMSISHYEVQEQGNTGVDIIDANPDFTALITDKGEAYSFESQIQDFKQVSSYTGDYQLKEGDNTIYTKELSRPFVESVKHNNNGYAPIYEDTKSGEKITVSLGQGKHNHIDVSTKLVTDSLNKIKGTKDSASGVVIQEPDVTHAEFNNKTSIKKGQIVFQYHRKGSDLEVIEENFTDH